MPELPELQALAEGLDAALAGRRITAARALHPATLRTAEPPLCALVGRRVAEVTRRGKLLIVGVHDGPALVIHLMSAGRLGLVGGGAPRRPRSACLDIDVGDAGTLRLSELGPRRRATAHVLPAGDLAHHPPLARLGPEPIGLSPAGWRTALAAPPAPRLHTALRDGRRVAGIGRAYAADIMWAARLAPFAAAAGLDDDALTRLAGAADLVLGGALERARRHIGTSLPARERRTTMVHGHHGEPCLRCARTLERVGFAQYDLVYCPSCQTGGRVYRDRRLSRLGARRPERPSPGR
jgi:formamidopyrimidine-DNA glycosylase